jgi:hypothetical protein
MICFARETPGRRSFPRAALRIDLPLPLPLSAPQDEATDQMSP